MLVTPVEHPRVSGSSPVHVPSQRDDIPPLVFGLSFFLVSAAFAVAQHLTFHTRARDMGIYVQILWNAGQGRPFISTLLQENTNHLAEHVAPALWPLVPVAGLAPDALPLLVLQQLTLALVGVPLYLVARASLGQRGGLALLLCFYVMPAISRVSLSEFHPIVLAALPMAAAAACVLAGRGRTAVLFLLLSLLVEEETAPTVMGLALVLAYRGWKRSPALPLVPPALSLVPPALPLVPPALPLVPPALPLVPPALPLSGSPAAPLPRFPAPPRPHSSALSLCVIGIAIAYTALAILVVMPSFRLSTGSVRGEVTNRAISHYDRVRQDPAIIGTWLATERGPDALAWLLLPTGGLALLAPHVLAADLPGLLVLLLQDRAGTYGGHWSAPLLPLVWMATSIGLRKLSSHPPLMRAGVVLMLAATGLAYYLDSYFPGGRGFEADHFQLSELETNLRQAADLVQPQASLVASRRVVPHLAARRDLYQFPFSLYSAPLRPDSQRQDFYILDLTDSPSRRAVEAAEADSVLEKRPRHHVARFGPDTLLLSRAPLQPAQARGDTFGGVVRLIGLSWPASVPSSLTAWTASSLSVRLFWDALRRPETEIVRALRLVGPTGETLAELVGQPLDDYLPFRDWDRGQMIAEELNLWPTGQLNPGVYRLVVSWQSVGGAFLAVDEAGTSHLELASLKRP